MTTNTKSTLYFKKDGDYLSDAQNTVMNLLTSFGSPIAVISDEPMIPNTPKEVTPTNFHDEHGEEMFDFENVMLDAFDVEFGLITTATSRNGCKVAYSNLLKYLTTNGMMHQMYYPLDGIGRRQVRYSGSSSFENWKNGNEEYCMSWKMKFRICDPVSEITLT